MHLGVSLFPSWAVQVALVRFFVLRRRLRPCGAAAKPPCGVRRRAHFFGAVPGRGLGFGVVVVELLGGRVQNFAPRVGAAVDDQAVAAGAGVVQALRFGRAAAVAAVPARVVVGLALAALPVRGVHRVRSAQFTRHGLHGGIIARSVRVHKNNVYIYMYGFRSSINIES